MQEKFSATGELANTLEQGLEALVDRHRLKPILIAQHQQRIKDLLAASSSDTDTFSPQNDQPWDWKPGIESPDLEVGLLRIRGNHDIPIHDHPGSSGLLLVLSGLVRLRSYKMVGGEQAQMQSPLELELIDDELIGPGEYCHFGPEQNNIHTMRAVDEDCLMFDVLFSPYELQQRSFFMPIVPNNGAQTFFVTRLNKLHSLGNR